jgi:hypothetical protein
MRISFAQLIHFLRLGEDFSARYRCMYATLSMRTNITCGICYGSRIR